MANIPNKPTVTLQEWIDEQTPLDHNNLTGGINTNLANIKTAVDGIIDALGGPGASSPSGAVLLIGNLPNEEDEWENTRINLTSSQFEDILLNPKNNQIIIYDDMRNEYYYFNKISHQIDEGDLYFEYDDGHDRYLAYLTSDYIVIEIKSLPIIYIGAMPTGVETVEINLTDKQKSLISSGVDVINIYAQAGSSDFRGIFSFRIAFKGGKRCYYCKVQDSNGRTREFVAWAAYGQSILNIQRISPVYRHHMSFTGSTIDSIDFWLTWREPFNDGELDFPIGDNIRALCHFVQGNTPESKAILGTSYGPNNAVQVIDVMGAIENYAYSDCTDTVYIDD